jgi:hypothetical protein
MLLMHYHEGSDEKLTAIVKIERPFWSGRPLAFEFGVLLVYVPSNIVEDPIVLLFTEGVHTGYLLNLPRLEYAKEHIQDFNGQWRWPDGSVATAEKVATQLEAV